MKTSSKLIIVLGIVAAFVVGLAVGVPLGTLLLVGAVLLCPAMMLFGMHGMQHGADGGGGCPNCGKHAHNQN
jgi:hypothetical protein